MGTDKARVPGPSGAPLAVGVARALAEVAAPVVLVRRHPEPPWTLADGSTLPVVVGQEGPSRHPLWGVAVALEHAAAHGARWAVVAPCDLPFLDGAAVRRLWDGARDGQDGSVAVSEDGRVHPLLAVLPTAAAAHARALAAQEAPSRALAEGRSPVALEAAALRNANRPEDLAAR